MTTDSHEAIRLARELGGVPVIREAFNPSCRTVFRYEGLSKWYATPRAAAEAYLNVNGVALPRK